MNKDDEAARQYAGNAFTVPFLVRKYGIIDVR